MTTGLIRTVTTCRRRLALAALALFAAGLSGLPAAAAPAAAALHPALTLPAFDAVSAEDYFPLLLEWSRDQKLDPVRVRITYLDPALLLAWQKFTNPATDAAAYEQALAGFPETLRFRVAYRAEERPQLKAKDWQAHLAGPDGAEIAAAAASRSIPADLKSDASGTYWEEAWDYSFAVPKGFLAANLAGFTLALNGPAGTTSASWQFGAVAATVDHSRAFVPWLGGALMALCLVLLAALFLTRAPRRRVS